MGLFFRANKHVIERVLTYTFEAIKHDINAINNQKAISFYQHCNFIALKV